MQRPLFEYVLLALLGSAGAVSPVGAPTRTFTADAVTQPSGGAEGLPGQAPGGDPDDPAEAPAREGKADIIWKLDGITGAYALCLLAGRPPFAPFARAATAFAFDLTLPALRRCSTIQALLPKTPAVSPARL
jgi:hypothetical protein